MATQTDFTISRGEDVPLVIQLNPATDVSTWSYQWEMTGRYGGGQYVGGPLLSGGRVLKSFNSGYMNGVSGITINNSGQGIFTVQLNSSDTSGIDPKAYVWQGRRLNSGFQNVVNEGAVIVSPSIP